MTRVCLFVAFPNGNSSHSFRHLHFGHYNGAILVQLPTGFLKDVEVHGLYDVIRLSVYDPVLCLLAVCRFQEIDCSGYGGDDPPCLGHVYKTGQVYDIPPLRDWKRFIPSSVVAVDIRSHEAS